MGDITSGVWIDFIAFFAPMCLIAYSLGNFVAQAIFRVVRRKDRPVYEKWGVATELFRPGSNVWFATWGVFIALVAIVSFPLALISMEWVTGDDTSASEGIYRTAIIAFYVAFIGFAVEVVRIGNIRIMTTKLEGLRDIFHQRFTVSELTSMYESLRHAPQIYWEEYINLPDGRISRETNRDYRERGMLYRHRQVSKENKILIVLTIVALILMAIPAAKDLLAY